MGVQMRMRLGARQCDRIDVRCRDEDGASGSGNAGKYSGARTHIQNGFRAPLAAENVHHTSAQTRGGMRSIPKYGFAAGQLGKPRKRYPTVFEGRRLGFGKVHRDSRGYVGCRAHLRAVRFRACW
jgi:hypothetical protein